MKFLQLIRYKNLLLVILTMYSVRAFYFQTFNSEVAVSTSLTEKIHFGILCFSIVLITAAGNIINDYFDVKADRINKPHRVIITKHIKKRWAIVLHWGFNIVAVLLGLYLSVILRNFSILIVQILAINLLWFYSMYFKKKAGIGNLLVSFLIAAVPLVSYVYLIQIGIVNTPPVNTNTILNEGNCLYELRCIHFWNNVFLQGKTYIILLLFFAFTLNMSREIIKDILDMKGDKLINAQTIPHFIGERNSANIAAIILACAPILFTGIFLTFIQEELLVHLTVLLPIVLSLIFNTISVALLLISVERKRLILAEKMIKLSMLCGVLIPFYWFYFHL